MRIDDIGEFLDYYERLRERTSRVIAAVPPDRFDWTYADGKFTIADLIRHLAGIERWSFAELVSGRPLAYPGHGRELADGPAEVVAYFDRLHAESMAIFRALKPEDLRRRCLTPAGAPITTWKFLRAMAEHEIHHRGQIYTYLGMLQVPTPALFGLTEQEVRARVAPTS